MIKALLLCLLVFASNVHAAGEDAFNKAVAEYENGEYERAVHLFELAEQLGQKNATLYFNLGLCYYQLNRNLKARNYFERARLDAKYLGIAEFQLALIEFHDGSPNLALLHLDNAEQAMPQLLPRVDAARSRILAVRPLPYLALFASAEIGHDANVQMTDNLVQPRKSDQAISTFLSLSRFGEHSNIGSSLYYQRYFNTPGSEQLVLSLSSQLHNDYRNKRVAVGLSGAQVVVAGSHFYRIFGPRFSIESTGDELWRPKAIWETDYIEADSSVFYLSGWRHRLELSLATPTVQIGLASEFNDRKNYRTPTAFLSQSLWRHDIFSKIQFSPLKNGLAFETRTNIKLSHYTQDNFYANAGPNQNRRRKEQNLRFSLITRVPSSFGINPFSEFTAEINRGNLNDLDYKRYFLSIGMDWFN